MGIAFLFCEFFSKIASRDNSGWLVIDPDLKASRAPVNKLNGSLCLDGSNSPLDIIEQAMYFLCLRSHLAI